MSLVTEIPLTGGIGSSVEIDYINEYGPTNAWVTLDAVTPCRDTGSLTFEPALCPSRVLRLLISGEVGAKRPARLT